MPRPYPAEFRARAVALVRAGRPISRVAVELGSTSCRRPVSLVMTRDMQEAQRSAQTKAPGSTIKPGALSDDDVGTPSVTDNDPKGRPQ